MARYDSGIRYGQARYDEGKTEPITHTHTMITLNRFLSNPFDDGKISLSELLSFSTDHLQRLIANNPGALYNARITATTTALAVVQNCATDDQVKLGVRKARKLVKDSFRDSLPGKIEKIAAVVVAKFGGGSGEFNECFPQGRTIFGKCPDDQVSNHLTALHTALLVHQANLGAQVVSDAAGLLSVWTAVYAASESSTGAKTTTEEGKRTAREGLQLQLYFNLLELAKNNARQPEKLDLYMRQALLGVTQSAPKEEPPVPPPGG